jgi:transposase
MKRRRFTEEFEAKVAVEALKGQRTVNELVQEFGVHANQINLWKKQLLDGAAKVLSHGSDRESARIEEERDQLYRKVGQLQIELDWLKKRTGSMS